MTQFLEFVDRKQKEIKKHLKIMENLFKKKNMKVTSFLDKDDPYLFVHVNEENNLSFSGIRIYQIGESIAYRIQKNSDTHPYGKSYMLDIESIFNDYMSEGLEPEKAGAKVIESVVEEIAKFFKSSEEAEMKLQEKDNKLGIYSKGVASIGTSLATSRV